MNQRIILHTAAYLFACLFISLNAQSQTAIKKVLIAEFSGVQCGNCPESSHVLDSLLATHPNTIGVALHTYTSQDAMYFNAADTIGTSYAGGAPLAAIDRILWSGTSSTNVAIYHTQWNNRITQQLATTPAVQVSLQPIWTASNRMISTSIQAKFLTQLNPADYRFNLYVVEDSVTGTGPLYDQVNLYNTQAGSPFFGLGNPIIGYVHRHTVRATLPYSWGQAGVIPNSPVNGQTYSTTLNYTLPMGYDETKVTLVAFVSKHSANHQTDEVLNAEEANLNSAALSSSNIGANALQYAVYPNPASSGTLYISVNEACDLKLMNITGSVLAHKNLSDNKMNHIDISSLSKGVYIAELSSKDNRKYTEKIIIE